MCLECKDPVACRAPIEPRDIDPIVDYLIGIGSSNWARPWMVRTTIQGYFCDPQNPWQRRSDENTNGLVGQYFPSGTDLSVYSQTHLSRVARQLNERPRRTLAFETPAVRFNACVAPTGGTGSAKGSFDKLAISANILVEQTFRFSGLR